MNARTKLLFIATFFTFITLYLPQPLQPLLAATYGKTPAQGSLLTSITLFPLALAPLLYGYILGNIHPAKLLKIALIGLGITNILFAIVTHFPSLILIRFIQGALIPILITAIISLLLENNPQGQRSLSLYVSLTILGGFSGRFLSTLFETYFTWESFSILVGITLTILAFLLPNASTQESNAYQRPHWRDFLAIIRHRTLITILLIIYLSFGSFVALLNYLPFFIRKSDPQAGTLITGLMYSGYIIGAIVSIIAPKIIERFHVRPTLLTANIAFISALILLYSNNLWLTFSVLFLFCAAFFLTHTTAIAEINRRSPYPKALTNAFYTSFYYTGAVIGVWLPGLIYQSYGKAIFITTLIATTLCATVAIFTLPNE